MGRFARLLLATAVVLTACQSEAVEPDPPTTVAPTTTTAPPTTLADVKAATVSVQWWRQDEAGRLTATTIGGTGSIVTSDGLILTNAHVVLPLAPGQAALYGVDSLPSANPDALVIAVVVAEDLPPEPRYIAVPVTVEGWIDLAVVRIVSDLDGNPIGPLSLPTVNLGDSDALEGGDPLIALGFPAVGGDTLSTTQGIVSGFIADDKLDTRRGWIKTDTPINPGNSGGVAVDSNLRLVGVPTRGNNQLDQLRPINLAKPLIDDAIAGRSYVAASGVVIGTGNQQLTLNRWGLGVDDEGTCITSPVDGYPAGAKALIGEFAYSGFTNGEDVAWIWFADGRFWYEEGLRRDQGWTQGPSGDCFWIDGYNPGATVPDGDYTVLVFAGAVPRIVANASVSVGGAAGGDTGDDRRRLIKAFGLVVDADSGEPIPDASAAFLVPGTDPEAWMADPSGETLISAGKTGLAGEQFEFSVPLDKDVAYPYIVFAKGYEVTTKCCFQVREDLMDEVLITFKLVRAPGGG